MFYARRGETRQQLEPAELYHRMSQKHKVIFNAWKGGTFHYNVSTLLTALIPTLLTWRILDVAQFLPCDALRCTVFVIVILSVCQSVTLVDCVHTVRPTIMISSYIQLRQLWYNCQWPWAYFKVIGLFHIKFLKNGVLYGKSYHRQLIGNHALVFDWWHFWWPWSTFEGHSA